MRIALSRAADQHLHELRLRRLLRLELEGVIALAAEPNGPLGDELIRVWIDVPTPQRSLIEVRRTGRPVARRALAIGGLPSDAAARLVAIAAGEMVRVQAQAAARPPPLPPPRRPPIPDEARPRLGLSSAFGTLWLPAADPEILFGPELSLEHRLGATGQALFGRWLVGSSSSRSARWLELGAALELRLEPADDWRIRLAARGAAAAVALPDAIAIDGAPSDSGASWTARIAGLGGLERRLGASSWLGLSLEPGASLRAQVVESRSGERSEVGGFALSGALSLTVEPDIYSD